MRKTFGLRSTSSIYFHLHMSNNGIDLKTIISALDLNDRHPD